MKTRANYQCERCSASPEAQRGFHAHHVYGRANHRLRFEPKNGCALCGACHREAEVDPIGFTDWFRWCRADDAAWLAAENRKGLLKRTLSDYADLENTLVALLAEAEARVNGDSDTPRR